MIVAARAAADFGSTLLCMPGGFETCLAWLLVQPHKVQTRTAIRSCVETNIFDPFARMAPTDGDCISPGGNHVRTVLPIAGRHVEFLDRYAPTRTIVTPRSKLMTRLLSLMASLLSD